MAGKHFVDHFHSLSGKTIGEKLKSLNQLISDVKSRCLPHEIDEFIVDIKPTNNFEKLLKGRIINSFKKSQDVLDVLQGEDKLFTKQMLCCDWFFEGSSADFPTCEFFIIEVFPNTSFNTRNDIIHLLSVHLRDEHVAEQFFKAVRSEYGLKQAKSLLCVCSEPFIQSVLDTDGDRVNFSEKEVSRLVRKYPKLVRGNIKKSCFSDVALVFELMLNIDVKIFTELFETSDYFGQLNIGRRGCKKIIRSNPIAVIKSAVKYIKVMKLNYLHKYLSPEQFKLFYKTLFPNTFEDPYFFQDSGNFYRVVEVLAPQKRLKMLFECFEEVYGTSLLSQTDLIREKLLLWLPPDKREMCAQQKIDKCVSKDEDETYWICYLTTAKSIPMLKKLLVEAPDLDSRSKLISYLTLTCKVNEDMDALASMLKHVVTRYRNDSISLRVKILCDLYDKFDLLKLDDRHWSSVLEVIKIFFLNEEYGSKGWLLRTFLAKSIHYNLINHADICEQIDQLIALKGFSSLYEDGWIILKEEPKYQQIIFEAFAERIPNMKKLAFSLIEVAFSLLNSVSNWNQNYKLFQFSLCKYSWVVESLRQSIDSNLSGKKDEILELLRYDLETKALVCPEHIYKEEVKKDVKYFLKMDLEKFIQNAEEELQFLLQENTKKYKHLFRTWNLQSFSQIKEVVVQICTQIVEHDEDTNKQEKAIFILSFLMNAESFASLIKPFYPVEEKINIADKNTEKMLPLIKTSAVCLKNVNPWSDFSCIKQFCKGDYLKYVLGSLMSVCYNSLQKKVIPFLEKLTNSPVSVKKHALRLSFNIVSMPQLLPLLNNLWNADKNPATREVLMDLVWRAFSEPTREKFALLKYCLQSIRVDDKNLFDKLSHDTHIPNEYKAEYMELCWDKAHHLLQQGAKIKPHISILISRFMYVTELLPSSFCNSVLKQYLCEGSPYKEECMKFAVTYVLKSQCMSKLNERFSFIFDLLKDLVEHSISGRNDAALFINYLCNDALILKYPMGLEVLQKFLSIWSSLLNPVYKFETFLLSKFTYMYFSCMPEFNLVTFGKISSDFVNSLIEEYGPESITLVSKKFREFVESVEIWCREDCEKQETRLSVITGLLTLPVSKHDYMMTAYLIPENFGDNAEVKERYICIMQTLLAVEDKTVCVIVNALPAFDNFTLSNNAMQTM